ncbi:hypothetical protein [Alteriqipengyuania sp.]|uniref:hypothetical protein n=1 Tax=Alteriqipengyuania sp. TaxID=2800692 RepID=UPI003516C4A3
MRVLPWFIGAVVVVAIGGAVAGAAISTTPRQIHDSPTPLSGASTGIGGQGTDRQALNANHYPLEMQGETYEVGELRERGLYSQDRYAPRYYVGELDEGNPEFDFAAADSAHRQWQADQRRIASNRRDTYRPARPAPTRPLDLERPAKVSETKVTFVSNPVVQDTSGMARR